MNDIKKIVRKSGTSFFWSMRFLPKAKREAMYTLYAFCRHIDDIVDGDSSIAEKQELLQAWREELDNIYDKKGSGYRNRPVAFIKTVSVSNCRNPSFCV